MLSEIRNGKKKDLFVREDILCRSWRGKIMRGEGETNWSEREK